MLWWLLLGLALAAMALSAFGAGNERRALAHAGAAGAYVLLAVWLWAQAGIHAFVGSESHLLGYFIVGLLVLALGELLAGWASPAWARGASAATAVAAVLFALGFDVLRPDAYAYVPAAILAVLVLAVMLQASRTLATTKVGRHKPAGGSRWRAVYIGAIGLLAYAALYKTADRGWPMLSAYLSAAGALLFVTAQVWWGWSVVLRKQLAQPWLRRLVLQAGVLLMVVAAFWVYRDFI